MQKIYYNNEPEILKNTDFQTIQIKVMFPFKDNVDDLAKIYLLPGVLTRKNNIYQTEEEMQKEKKKLYILSCNVYTTVIGDVGTLTFSLTIPDKKSLGKDYIEEQIKFFKDFIYNPLVEDKGFIDFDLERERDNLKLAINNAYKNVKPYQSVKLKEIFDNEGNLLKDVIYHQELIDKVTTKNLYEYYNNLVTNGNPAIFIMGNVDDDISSICKKYLYLNKFDKGCIEGNLYNFFNVRSDVCEVVEKSSFKDSSLAFVYKVRNMKKDEYVYLNLVRDLLCSLSSRLLDKKLRDENELVYSSSVISYSHYGALEITTFINKDNVEIVKEKIHEVINDLKNVELIEPLLDNIKDRKRINLLRKLDDKYLIFNDYIVKSLGIDDTAEEYYELVKKINANDISKFIDRFVLDTIYFLEEGEHE